MSRLLRTFQNHMIVYGGIMVGMFCVYIMFVGWMGYAGFWFRNINTGYVPIHPSRMVESGPKQSLEALVQSKSVWQPGKANQSVTLSEQELSGVLAFYLEQQTQSLGSQLLKTQTVIHPDGIELVLQVRKATLTYDVKTKLSLSEKDGILTITHDQVQANRSLLTSTQADHLQAWLVSPTNINQLKIMIGSYTLAGFQLNDGTLTLSFQ